VQAPPVMEICINSAEQFSALAVIFMLSVAINLKNYYKIKELEPAIKALIPKTLMCFPVCLSYQGLTG
jgi:hypothetical protein